MTCTLPSLFDAYNRPMPQSPSIFTHILNGDIPCHKIYEDEHTLAFLDIHPAVEGHTLVIPKVEIEFLWDLPEADYLELMRTVQKVGSHLRTVLGTPYVGVKVVGVDVPHTHVHLLPFSDVAQYNHPGDLSSEPDHAALASLAARLAF